MNDWITFKDAFIKENQLRIDRDISKYCSYGITPLDDAFHCIMPNELVVIGADSGAGKSELAVQIAQHNLHKGKRVALYHLEGGWLEAISRMKWRDITKEYFSCRRDKYIDLDYRSWVLNKYKDNELMQEIENDVWNKYKKEYLENLFFYSCKEGLTKDKFLSSLIDFGSFENNIANNRVFFDIDLIIIDHLQYFSLTQAESEISEMTAILRQVKSITEDYNIPVVLVSHLRKKGKDRGLPDQEDFYGTSNIPKIANTAIILAPCRENESLVTKTFPTWIRVVKSRIGLRPHYAMLCNFDQTTRSYADYYKIYKLMKGNFPENEPLTNDNCPQWARGALCNIS